MKYTRNKISVVSHQPIFHQSETLYPQASKAFHLVYIVASRLIIDSSGQKRKRNVSSNESSRSQPLRIFGLYIAAVIISCINFFVETVRNSWMPNV